MQHLKISFVIGSAASGKTNFIEHHFSESEASVLNIYDYQHKAYDEAGYGRILSVPRDVEFRILKKANDMHLHDIIEQLKQGKEVVAEQTFFKAKRRIAYIDEIRKAVPSVRIIVYVMQPSDERWAENIKLRKMPGGLQAYKEQAEKQFEFPNVSEGFDEIYEVCDGEVKLRMDKPKPQIAEQARAELAEEAARLEKEEEKRRKHEELLGSMKTRPFWHYCEVCGKKEYITAKQAFDAGWDYPPDIGQFGLLGPRKCGDCQLEDTLYWKVHNEERFPIPIVIERILTDEEIITWQRIKAEPESLLEETGEIKE